MIPVSFRASLLFFFFKEKTKPILGPKNLWITRVSHHGVPCQVMTFKSKKWNFIGGLGSSRKSTCEAWPYPILLRAHKTYKVNSCHLFPPVQKFRCGIWVTVDEEKYFGSVLKFNFKVMRDQVLNNFFVSINASFHEINGVTPRVSLAIKSMFWLIW